MSLMVTISRTRDDTQRVLDSFIIENASEIYVSVKNGNNTTLSTAYDVRFKTLVASELGLTQSGSAMYSETADKNIIFYYNNLRNQKKVTKSTLTNTRISPLTVILQWKNHTLLWDWLLVQISKKRGTTHYTQTQAHHEKWLSMAAIILFSSNGLFRAEQRGLRSS